MSCLAVLIFIVALAVRLYAIDRQSLWGDEGSSISLASRSFAQIARDIANDAHPPLFFEALHIWMSMLGTSVFAVRSFSAVCGALTVSITYILGRRWFSQPAAIIAAIAALLSPFAIHYAQETRMYTLVTLFGALAWLALDAWLAHLRWRALAFFWLAALAALLSHYFAAAIMVAANLTWLINVNASMRRQRMVGSHGWKALDWRRAAAWCGVQALLVALYLPSILRNRTTLANWPTISRGAFGPSYVVSDSLQVFSRGMSVNPGWTAWDIGFLVLLTAGLLARSYLQQLPDGRAIFD